MQFLLLWGWHTMCALACRIWWWLSTFSCSSCNQTKQPHPLQLLLCQQLCRAA